MSNLTSSIVKGFGFTLGRAAATSIITPSKEVINKSTEIDCWSHKGYEENDVEISYDFNYFNKFIKWYTWVAILFVPYLTIFYTVKYFYNVFIKTNKIYYYDMKWKSFKVSDGRTKSGIRELQKLQPELSKVEIYPPYTRNKIEAIISLAYSSFIIGLMIFSFYK